MLGREYEEGLSKLVTDLHEGPPWRLSGNAIAAGFITKADGRQRLLDIASLEGKIVLQTVVTVLKAVYEEDFLGFSYGFWPGHSQHDALDALTFIPKGQR